MALPCFSVLYWLLGLSCSRPCTTVNCAPFLCTGALQCQGPMQHTVAFDDPIPDRFQLPRLLPFRQPRRPSFELYDFAQRLADKHMQAATGRVPAKRTSSYVHELATYASLKERSALLDFANSSSQHLRFETGDFKISHCTPIFKSWQSNPVTSGKLPDMAEFLQGIRGPPLQSV